MRSSTAILLIWAGLQMISCHPSPRTKPMHTNALIHEASPYLQQHAHNPVNWVPWGDAAFEQARRENKPIFLSIGYAACHWCHVMEHESFENDTIAAYLNEHFVAIKVDREERPDVDHHYMQAVQRMTGQGGWPLSVFLTPDRKPFFGGTYWPAESKFGRPGFLSVLQSVERAWKLRHDEILSSASEFHEILRDSAQIEQQPGDITLDLLKAAVRGSEQSFDSVHGGFGSAPKFPHAMELGLLLRLSARLNSARAREMALFTLRKMARGGMYDQLGGGFHRYSTDARWLIPHFEKMLYDNALHLPVYLDAYAISGDDEYRETARQTLEWVLREMSTPEGGFASSLDADSEGEEGRFYVWTPTEIASVLGEERGHRFCRIYDVTDAGNFEGGRSALNLVEPLETELAEDRSKLLTAREQRVRPARDDKVLTDWNGLMISALVRGFAVLNEPRYLDAAQRTADRLLSPFEVDGRLVHSFLGNRTLETQLLMDYAALGNGLLDVFLADGNQRWFNGAISLARTMDERFSMNDGLYKMSADDIAGANPIDPFDSAMPSGISLAGNLLSRLHHLTGDEWYEQRAQQQVLPVAGLMQHSAQAFSQGMITVDHLLHPPAQLVLVGDKDRTLWREAQQVYAPGLQITWQPNEPDVPESSPLASLFEGKTILGNKATAYLCRNFVCELPTSDPKNLRESLSKIESVATESAIP